MQTLISGFRRIASAIPSQTSFIRHATKKAKGSSNNGRDSPGKRLGPKVNDGEYVETGHILVRQRGTKMWAGMDVGCGRDHTLYALTDGIARFCRAKPRPGLKKGRVYVSVEPAPEWRWKSIQKKIKRLEIARYRGPILHAPR
ncbi:unnamed protein product [Agarophyton chilense]